MPESFLNGRVMLHPGDCLDILATLPENSIDSCVTDPPYHFVSIYKRFANEARNEATVGNGAYGRHAKGFMGKIWDGGDVAFRPETWAAVYRVLKPGAHLLAFGGTRTYHRLACAIEDAGFEIRDCIQWIYGSGFPKSHDVSKAIDRAAGAEREIVGPSTRHVSGKANQRTEGLCGSSTFAETIGMGAFETAPATDAARQWYGYGTALKPACEPIILARKPLSESTVAANVLKWGTGALNIDGCRVDLAGDYKCGANGRPSQTGLGDNDDPTRANQHSPVGRWPANITHDGSEEVVGAFPENAGAFAPVRGTEPSVPAKGDVAYGFRNRVEHMHHGDSGSAARFFYTAKADQDDRLGSKHPTVKPLDLMQYLVRLVTPPKGLVVDPFSGTGTTGEAAFREGMSAVLIEREEEYQSDIRRRMALALSGPDERARERIKERQKGNLPDHGPLFGGSP